MKTFLIAVVFASIGFAGGYGYSLSSAQAQRHAELGELALQALQLDLGIAHYMATGQTSKVPDLVDVSVSAGLNQLREHTGYPENPEWVRAKVKTLNSLALLWEARKPFQDPVFDDASLEWVREWQVSHAANVKLLQWATTECRQHPEYTCKDTPPQTPHGP